MNDPEQFDVVVIGGGPGGASAATVLARAGKRVVLLERERFPRFQIGESLLPAGWELWRRLGIAEKIEAEGFTVKLPSRLSPGGLNLVVYTELLGESDRVEANDPAGALPKNQDSWK